MPDPRVEAVVQAPVSAYKLPPRFYHDHVARDCLPGVLVRETSRQVVVELDAAAYADLLSDADYYSDASAFEPDLFGLCASARATYRALLAQGRPGELSNGA